MGFIYKLILFDFHSIVSFRKSKEPKERRISNCNVILAKQGQCCVQETSTTLLRSFSQRCMQGEECCTQGLTLRIEWFFTVQISMGAVLRALCCTVVQGHCVQGNQHQKHSNLRIFARFPPNLTLQVSTTTWLDDQFAYMKFQTSFSLSI